MRWTPHQPPASPTRTSSCSTHTSLRNLSRYRIQLWMVQSGMAPRAPISLSCNSPRAKRSVRLRCCASLRARRGSRRYAASSAALFGALIVELLQAVAVSHYNVICNLVQTATSNGLTDSPTLPQEQRWRPGDRGLAGANYVCLIKHNSFADMLHSVTAVSYVFLLTNIAKNIIKASADIYGFVVNVG